ncbi:UNVERIFIED_CONTAM: glycosyltransferase family 2 protein [Methylobacteriaceae bacterium AG10]|nr:glycosyltransferase family 2 protein [Methylobacteriaceae bacterium AG10]
MRTFAIVAVVEGAAPDLFEWLAVHRAVGVRHFVIYDNGLDGEAAALLKAHEAIGVTTLPCPTRVGTTPLYAAINHFLASRARLFRFAAFLGLDEVLVPAPGRSIQDWIARIPAHAGAVVVNRRVFDTAEPEGAPGDLLLRRFPRSLADTEGEANRVVTAIYRQGAVAAITDANLVPLVQGERLMSDFSPAEPDPRRPDAVLGVRHGEIRLNFYPASASADSGNGARAETEPCLRTRSWIGPTLDEMRHFLAYAESVAPAEAARLRARAGAVPELARPVAPREHRLWRLRQLHRPRVEAAGRFVRRKLFGAPRPW